MIGCYDYTVLLTYLGALAGLFGTVLAVQGRPMETVFCMAVALLCDTLDGIVARGKKERTEEEMLFGIQIDSLCDLISFGVCPAVLFFSLGMDSPEDLLLLGGYCLCCVIRLAFFNVLALRQEPGSKGDYRGLPVVCLDTAVPALLLVGKYLPAASLWALRSGTALFGFLYIYDFPVKKADIRILLVMAAGFCVPLALLLL